MSNKLELTWYGKDDPIRVEPRLLIENAALSNRAASPDYPESYRAYVERASHASYVYPMDHIIIGPATALRFDCVDDPQSVDMLGHIQKLRAKAVLADHTELDEDNTLLVCILNVYRKLVVV